MGLLLLNGAVLGSRPALILSGFGWFYADLRREKGMEGVMRGSERDKL